MKRLACDPVSSDLIVAKAEGDPANDAPPITGSSKKKPYKPPKVTEYGNVARLTAGANGSRLDPGHSTGTKLGNG